MHFFTRRTALAAALVSVVAPHAFGQAYPSKPITLVVPYPAGAAVDGNGRALAAELSKHLGQTVLVDNVAGASGTIGATKVKRSTPDGYTLMVGTINDLLVAPTVMKLGYSAADFTPIAKLTLARTVLVAHPSFPANTADELIALARRNKEPLLMGATGAAAMQTVGGMMLADAAGFKITNVVYKGGAPMVTDLLGGQIKVGTSALASVLPHIRDGRLKALGMISNERDPTAPGIPTVNEGKAVKGISADLWTGLVGPANLPAPIVSKLSAAMQEILADPKFKETQLQTGSVTAAFEDPVTFGRYIKAETTRLAPALSKMETQ